MNKNKKVRIKVKEGLPIEVQEEIKLIIKKCYSCSRCTSGCPVASEMDFPPSLIMRWLSLGEYEKILKSKALWVCSSCHTCYGRCPFEINIPHVIDLLKEYSDKNKLTRVERPTRLFHKIFLGNIKGFGRMYETGFIGVWKIFSGKWFSDLPLGFKMFLKKKLPVFPEKIKNLKEVRRLFKKNEKK